MNEIIDYDILTFESQQKLVDAMKAAIADGWQPFGFMELKGEYQYTTYTQTIVKCKKV